MIYARFAFFILSKSLHELNELCFKIFSFCATMFFWFSMLNVRKIKNREAPFFCVQRICPDWLNCATSQLYLFRFTMVEEQSSLQYLLQMINMNSVMVNGMRSLLSNKNVVKLSVNKIFAQPGISVTNFKSTDTNNPLYLGGHNTPEIFGNSTILGQTNYHGCMKDVVIEGKRYKFSQSDMFGDISSHCPTI